MVASFLSAVPWLVTLSRHKNWVFLVAGLLIAGNFLYVHVISTKLQARRGACSVDGLGVCTSASRMSRAVLWLSGTLYCIGFFSAYVIGPLLMRFGD